MSDPVFRVLAATAVVVSAATLGLGVYLLVQLPPPPAALPLPSPRAPLETAALDDLRQALAVAARACPCAEPPSAPRSWARVVETLGHNPLVLEREVGELPGLQREAGWLGAVAEGAPLGARSVEDQRFLHGFLHWYLDSLYAYALRSHYGDEAEPQPELRHGGPSYDQAALREFRGLSYGDLLGLLD